jgi:hypothetical protein
MDGSSKEQAQALEDRQESTFPAHDLDVEGRDGLGSLLRVLWQAATPPPHPHGIEISLTPPSSPSSSKRKYQVSPTPTSQFTHHTLAVTGITVGTLEPQPKRIKGTPRAGFLLKLPDLSYLMPPGRALNFTAVEIIAILPDWFKHQSMATRLLNNGVTSGTHFAILKDHRDMGQDGHAPDKTKTGISDLYRKAMRKVDTKWTRQSHKVPEGWKANIIAVNGFLPDSARIPGYKVPPSIPFKDLMTGLTKLPQGNDAGDLTCALVFATRNQKTGPDGETQEFMFPEDIHVILHQTGYLRPTPEHTDQNVLGRYQANLKQTEAAQRAIYDERRRREATERQAQAYTPQYQALQPQVPRQVPAGVVNFPRLEGWSTATSTAMSQPQSRYNPSVMTQYPEIGGEYAAVSANEPHPVFSAHETKHRPNAAWPIHSSNAGLYEILRTDDMMASSQHDTAAPVVSEVPVSMTAVADAPEIQLPVRYTSPTTTISGEPVKAIATADTPAIHQSAVSTPAPTKFTEVIQAIAQDDQPTADDMALLSACRNTTSEADSFFEDLITGAQSANLKDTMFTTDGMDDFIASHQDYDYSDLLEPFESNEYETAEEEVLAMIPHDNKTQYPSTQLLRECAEGDDLSDESDLAMTVRFVREPSNHAFAFTVGHVDHVMGLVRGSGWSSDSHST